MQAGRAPGRPTGGVGVDPRQVQQPGRQHSGRGGVPLRTGRVVVPPRHAVGGQVVDGEGGRPARCVQQPRVARRVVRRREAVHGPGLAARPRRPVGQPLHGPGPDRLTAGVVEPDDVEGAAVGPYLPARHGERVLDGDGAPLLRAAVVGRPDEEREVHQAVDDDRGLAGRPVPAAERAHGRNEPGGQGGGGPAHHGGVVGAAEQVRAARRRRSGAGSRGRGPRCRPARTASGACRVTARRAQARSAGRAS